MVKEPASTSYQNSTALSRLVEELPRIVEDAGVSLGAIIESATYGSKSKYDQSLRQLDAIIPNFVSKHVRKVCQQEMRNLNSANHTADQSLQPSAKETRDLKELNHTADQSLQPSAKEAFAALVMVDVSGYSKLAAALAERGSEGAEILSKTMKGYFDLIIDVIENHGGDIVKFAGNLLIKSGDAVILCWKSEEIADLEDASQDIARGELVFQAANCCLKLLTNLGTFAIDIEGCDTKFLRIHLGIGAGSVFDVVVGGDNNRWEHFVAGESSLQLAQVLDLAKAGTWFVTSGELALSHQALRYLGYVIDIRTLDLGNYDKRCIKLIGLEKAKRKGRAARVPEEKAEDIDCPELLEMYKRFMDRTAIFKLQSDVNQSRLFGMDINLKEMLNHSELRQVTTIFIKIGSLQILDRDALLYESQKAISIVLKALQKYEGSLRQFHVDDKGAGILCFFGLPPLAHDNDAKHGLQAGMEIRSGFLKIFDKFAMGITTGVVSYGGVGSNGRAEYAVVRDF